MAELTPHLMFFVKPYPVVVFFGDACQQAQYESCIFTIPDNIYD